MLEKIRNYAREDALLFHKLGLFGGTLFGLLLGFVISDKADKYAEVLVPEVLDGQEEH